MRDGYWVIRTYVAGSVGEKTKFWVQGARPTASSRREKSDIKKQEQNEHSAEKQLARLINANFGPGDLLLGLDYSPEGFSRITKRAEKQILETDSEAEKENKSRAGAEHEMKLAIRRVKRELAKKGIDLKYIAITSDMDGDTGEAVRVHHHLIVPASAKDAFVEKWQGLGHVSWSHLSDQTDYTPIAAYFLRQVRRLPDAKKYISSRNLDRPVPKDRAVYTDAELRVPRGGEILHRNEYKPGRPQYIRYALPPEQRKKR